ncbi:MAG: exo-alpha-sialidase [Thermoplasmata archaeon]|nr:MAG: exo-alpha-sialidase [Thermoplasmata archaeon]
MKKLYLIVWIVTFTIITFGFNNLKLCTSAEIFTSNLIIEGNLTSQVQPSITLDDFGNIYMVWRDYRNDTSLPSYARGDIYFAKSTNSGMSFSDAQKVSDDLGDAQQNIPSVSVDSCGVIHVVWEDWRNDADGRWVGSDGGIDGLSNGDIYYANSTDSGTTWSTSKKINDDGGTTEQGRPDITVDSSDIIHIVWEDRRRIDNFDIYYANSTDGGLSFSINEKVNDVDVAARDPAIAIDDKDNIHIAWCDYRNTGTTGPDIYYANSTDGGITFSSNKRISDDTADIYQYWPDIAANGGIIGIVWDDDRENSLYFANSTDGGITFSPNKRVNSFTGGMHQSGSIAINSDGYMCIAWEGSGIDIYFANSTDGGAIFSPSQRVNDDTGSDYQRLPSLTLRNKTIYIAWQDNRNGNYDIYFSRSNFIPPMTIPISPANNSTLINNPPTLVVTPVTDLDNDTVYYNFTISDQTDAESGTVYYSGWITYTSWKPPPLANGIWYWHTYTSDMWNTTSPNWVWNFTINSTLQSYEIQLYEGWNLISIPFIQIDTSLDSVLDNINGSYDAVQWYDADGRSDHWEHYQTSKPSDLNDLKAIDHTMGFWVHITEPGGALFRCSGIQPTENQSVTLYPGWNLVGYPSLSNNSVSTALNSLTLGEDVDSIWTYNATSQKWEEIGDLDYFERGRGYWVLTKTDCVWEVPL